MAPAIAYTLPAMQVVCNLVMPGGSDSHVSTSFPILNVTRLQPQNVSDVLPDGYVAYPEITAAYKIYGDEVTWKVARARCFDEGARLAVIDSIWKFDSLMNQAGPNERIIHVGIHSLYDDTEWVSATTGATLTNLPWASGEPTGGHDLVVATKSPRGLRNFPMNSKRPYACELPIYEDYGDSKKELE